ncbi:phosphoribosylanthranilate isomerase [Desulfomarina sp.]
MNSVARTRVKMCGTTRLEDAAVAVNYGVDALGFILYKPSPRYISAEKAKKICDSLSPFVDRVGVVVNEEPDRLISLVGTIGFSHLQLHGDESVPYCKNLRENLPHVKLLKAFRVSELSVTEDFTPYEDCVDGFLLDTWVKGEKGGTGKAFDWSIIRRLVLRLPVVLAGGLNGQNIGAAIASVNPYAVDINSGVESAPGIKNHRLLKEVMGKIYCQNI